MNLITEARVREVLEHTPLLDDEDYAHLTAQANADPGEGADWLPFYKLALGVLMHAFGVAEGAATGLCEQSPWLKSVARCRQVLDRAKLLARLSCRPCGIGPDATAERAAVVDGLLDEEWPADGPVPEDD